MDLGPDPLRLLEGQLKGYLRKRHYFKIKYDDPIHYRKTLQGDICSYCGGPGGTIDHIIPSAEEGKNTILNLTGACYACNQEKATKPLFLWLSEKWHR